MRASEIIDLYKAKYDHEPMCTVDRDVPDIKEIQGKHGWKMGGVQVHSSGKRVVVVVSMVSSAGYVLMIHRVFWITC